MSNAPLNQSTGLNRAVRQIGDGWSLLIVWEALNGTSRFDNFQNRLGVARNILSSRLVRLVEEGILVKRPVRVGARRLEYRPTSRAEALRPALEMIESWGRTGLTNGAEASEAASKGVSNGVSNRASNRASNRGSNGVAAGAPLNGRAFTEIRH
ncbi:MAG TPA: helix-turn-helix domain-containing protein [Thermohalobaculum sp.]|nr:helix-turn-helix domain-containing protein [Thermohalobaculum sp.]